jgi:hypothetical protein
MKMRMAKWWTPDTIFAAGLGALMAGIFGASFFAQSKPKPGNVFEPVLQEIREVESVCKTITDADVRARIQTGVAQPRC